MQTLNKPSKKHFFMSIMFVALGLFLVGCFGQTVRLTFETNGGSEIAPVEVEQRHIFGTLPETTRTGYTFLGWFQDKELTTSFDTSEPLMRNRIIYAKWTINEYTISFETYGGETVNPITANYGTTVSAPALPQKEGHQFEGWFTDASYSTPFEFSTMAASDRTAHAKWDIIRHTVTGNHIFLRENFDTGAMEEDAPSIPFSRPYLAYGSHYLPVGEFEGYTFVKFVYDGVDYDNIEDVLLVNDDLEQIDVYYARRTFTIHFLQDKRLAGFVGSEEDAIIEHTYRVYYNDSFTGDLPTLIITDEDYNASWNRTLFQHVKQNIDVRPIYYLSGVKTVTFIDSGAVRYFAAENVDTPDQILTEASPIWQLTRPNYRFDGWYTAPEGGTKLSIEELKFSHFAESVTLYAQWVSLEAFQAPENLDIDVYENGTIAISWTLTPATIAGHDPVGFELFLNGILIQVALADLTIDGATFMLVLLPEDDLYDSFDMLLASGMHLLSVRALGDQINHISSPQSEIKAFVVDIDVEGDIIDAVAYDYFIIETIEIAGSETRRYVFYSDMTYNFSDRYHFEIISGHVYASAAGQSLSTASSPGNFRFSMSVDGGTPVVYEGRVAANINQFAAGLNYMTYLNETTGSDYLNTTDITPYLVGWQNPFTFDFRMVNNSGQRVPLQDTLLVYEFYLNDDESPLSEAQLSTYLTFIDAHQIQFTEAAEGHAFHVVVRPRYQALLMQVEDVTFDIVVNAAHNAFTNTQLRALFYDMSVSAVNIHANLEATLAPQQMNEDGSPINIAGDPTASSLYTALKGNVYGRAHNATSGETFVINGNYMTIDGSDLPYSNRDSGSGILGYSAAFEVVNVQISMFYYAVYDASNENVNDNHLFINNLTLLGNTTTPSINYGQSAEEIANQEQLMSRNSGGYNGVMVRRGSSTLNNMRIGYMLIPLFNTAYGSQSGSEIIPIYMTINDVKLYDSWANSIYLHGATGMVINKSDIGQSGGAAIHLVDNKPGDGIASPTLIIDADTAINNWISGEEAWFKAYAMSPVALQLKSQVQQSIAPLGKSILKEIANPVTGLPTEMINFILLTEPSNSATDDDLNPTTGSEFYLNLTDDVGMTTLHRAFNYLATPDPRIQGGGFLFAVGHLSTYEAFMGAVGEGMTTHGLTQAQAVEIAYLAGFNNLTVEETLTVVGTATHLGIPFAQAMDVVMGEDHPKPGLLEILYNVPIFGAGHSTVIVEVFDLE